MVTVFASPYVPESEALLSKSVIRVNRTEQIPCQPVD